MARGRLSIPTLVFLGFAFVLVAFGAVAGVSLWQHARTTRTLRLLNEGYLPLALTLGEAKATQALYATLLDRVVADPRASPARSWLNAARHVRPATLRRAYDELSRADALAVTAADRSTLRGVRASLDEVGTAYGELDDEYDTLFAQVDAGSKAPLAAAFKAIELRELGVQRHYRDGWAALQHRLATTSAEAAAQERRAALLLGLLTLLGLAGGVAATWWTQRLLEPLPRLHERVLAVARGDLSRDVLRSSRDDELGRLTNEFERMVEALSERDAQLIRAERLAAIGRMAAHVTHEVRNPLSSIGLNVEMLGDELSDAGDEARALMAAIQREIDRLGGITEEYLRLARLPRPRLAPDDLTELVRSVERFVGPEMEQAGVTLSVVTREVPRVAIDEPQLRQALLNLLRNAREAMPGGGRVQVTLEPAARGEGAGDPAGVRLRVEDDGQGIPPDVREQIFDLFYTTKERGTGLGLPLTHQIVVAHGGQLRCLPRQPRGTVFELWLPAYQAGRGETP